MFAHLALFCLHQLHHKTRQWNIYIILQSIFVTSLVLSQNVPQHSNGNHLVQNFTDIPPPPHTRQPYDMNPFDVDPRQDPRGSICEDPCTCHHNGMHGDMFIITCARRNLTAIPERIPTEATSLDLSHNSIGTVEASMFPAYLPRLRHLNLLGCGIHTLEHDAFNHLPALEELGLEHNQITAIHAGMFFSSNSLGVFTVSDNNISELDNQSFHGLHLKELSLQNNPLLSQLRPLVFDGAAVERMSLDRCNLTTISTTTLHPLQKSLKALHWSNSLRSLRLPSDLFQGFHLEFLSLSNDGLDDLSFLTQTIVVHLDLSFNHLFYFDVGLYPGITFTEVLNLHSTDLKQFHTSRDVVLNELYELDISANHLARLDLTLFYKMPHLRHLNAANNLLTAFPAELEGIFRQLDYLDLTGNKLICDCALHWFISLSHSVQFSTDLVIEGVQCVMATDDVTQSTSISQPIRTEPCESPIILDLSNVGDDSYEQRLFNFTTNNSTSNVSKCIQHRREQANSTVMQNCTDVYNSEVLGEPTLSLRVRCSAVGHPTPVLTWWVCDRSISQSTLHTWSITNTTDVNLLINDSVVESTLMIAPFTCLPITCTATNHRGTDKLTFFPCANNASRDTLCSKDSQHPSSNSYKTVSRQHLEHDVSPAHDARLVAGVSVAVALGGCIILPAMLICLWRYLRKTHHRKRPSSRGFARAASTRSHVCLVNQDEHTECDIICSEDDEESHVGSPSRHSPNRTSPSRHALKGPSPSRNILRGSSPSRHIIRTSPSRHVPKDSPSGHSHRASPRYSPSQSSAKESEVSERSVFTVHQL